MSGCREVVRRGSVGERAWERRARGPGARLAAAQGLAAEGDVLLDVHLVPAASTGGAASSLPGAGTHAQHT